MTTPDDLLDFAFKAVMRAEGPEASIRRVISAAYYGLFHAIAQAAACLFDAPPELRDRLARSFSHIAVKRAADEIFRTKNSGVPTDSRLLTIAVTFRRLQEAREKADYELATDTSWDEAEELVVEASQAVQLLRELGSYQAATEFLLSPLFQRRKTSG